MYFCCMKKIILDDNKEYYITSDNHFGHENIIKYCNRNYSDVHQMNKDMTIKWNNIIGEDDIIFHLGDFSFRDSNKYLNQLNGKIILIRGNHDCKSTLKAFSEVYQRLHVEYKGYNFLLNHKPILSDKIPDPFNDHDKYVTENLSIFDYYLVGHVHEKWLRLEKNYNIGVDMHNFKPITLNYIIKKIKTYD